MARWPGFAIGIAAVTAGVLAILWGSGQCLLLLYDPLCPLKSDGPILGGAASIVAGAVGMGILGARAWRDSRA